MSKIKRVESNHGMDCKGCVYHNPSALIDEPSCSLPPEKEEELSCIDHNGVSTHTWYIFVEVSEDA